jgi:hypothetical protein
MVSMCVWSDISNPPQRLGCSTLKRPAARSSATLASGPAQLLRLGRTRPQRRHEGRVGSIVSAARRILNVDQAQVLSLDAAGDEIVLNARLLRDQFELGEQP